MSFTELTGRGGDGLGDAIVNTYVTLVYKTFESLRYLYAYYGIRLFTASVCKVR